jgi:hypothetical protein
MRKTWMLAGALSLALTGCGGGADDKEGKGADRTADAGCADDGEKLALTGLCKGRAVNYMNMEASASPQAPDGCEWQVMEAALPADEVLLYRGLVCGKKAAQIEIAGGAERAEVKLVRSAMSDAMPEPFAIGYLYTAEGEPAKAITQRARSVIEDPAEAAKCNARPANIEGWPKDAFVVDTDPKGSNTADGSPVAVCGDLGYFDEGFRFWRAAQGYAWFFDFGQDLAEIDPASLTIVAKDADGQWGAIGQ